MSETSELDAKFLETFPSWLKALSEDARALGRVVADTSHPAAARACLATGLNYLLKSIDLIADGIEDLGYLDDAFVLRVAALGAEQAGLPVGDSPECSRLAQESQVVREFLQADYQRLADYVAALASQPIRQRSAEQVADDASLSQALVQDVNAWADAYVSPGFSKDEKNLVKLRAFMNAKLPATE